MNRSLPATTRSRAFLAVFLAVALTWPLAAGAVTREAVLRRGEVWVAKKVPYSQSGYATASGVVVSSSSQGWRRDCSGFVSMCLGLLRTDGAPLSLDTATLPGRLVKISKSELRPGDIILRPKNLIINGKQVPYGHAVVFVRWADAAKTTYVGYHESGSNRGAVAQDIRYPFWGEAGFAPYRYKQIENVRLRRSRTWTAPVATGMAPSLALGAFPTFPSIGLAPPSITAP